MCKAQDKENGPGRAHRIVASLPRGFAPGRPTRASGAAFDVSVVPSAQNCATGSGKPNAIS